MKEVVLEYRFRITPKNGGEITYISCGGFAFNIRHPKTGKMVSVQFDFDATGITHVTDNVYKYASGEGFAFNEYDISSDYKESYEEMGLSMNDITAELLSKAESIEEMFVMIDTKEGGEEAPYSEYVVEEIALSDGENDYEVSKEVIDAFNKKMKNELAS